MEILTHPNESLRQISTEVQVFDELLKLLVEKMVEQMYVSGGIGLAAPQVGLNKRIIIIDPSNGEDATKLTVMINPRITSSNGKAISIEGCLSIPKTRGEVERFAEVTVEYQSLTGEKLTLKSIGLPAIIIQHEIDHLDGVLFIDRVKAVHRLAMRKTG